MKEGNPIDRENKLLDLVNYQAQRAILSDLPEEKKDQIVKDAIHSIQSIAERKAAYLAKREEGERTTNQDE